MGNLKVPESPTTYTTHYEDLKGIDCYTPNTEISNNHAADMVNMYPEGGIPIKRRGWRKIQEFDSNIVTAYYDVYNDITYVATESGIAYKSGSFESTIQEIVPNEELDIDTYISFKLSKFTQTVEIDEPYKGISAMWVIVNDYHYIDFEKQFTSSEIAEYFSFGNDNFVRIAVSDLATICDTTERQLLNAEISFDVTHVVTTPLTEISTPSVKHIIPFNGKIYFIANNGIFTLENNVPTPINPTVPITKYSLSWKGEGGMAYYSVNALTQEQTYLFHGDGQNAKFYPHGMNFNTETSVNYIYKIKKVELWNGNSWGETQAYTVGQGSYDYAILNANGEQTTIRTDTYVQFNTAPDNINNGDNVKITVEELDVEVKGQVSGVNVRWGRYNRLMHKILDADINIIYGSVDADRLFVVLDGNRIYYSEAGNINYFPDDNYIVAGNYAPIVGLHRKDDNLVAVTGESDSHAVYIIKSSTAVVTSQEFNNEGGLENTSHEEQFFSVHPAASGKGAIAPRSFATLVDDPLYLGMHGIYSISSNYYTSQTMIVNRSTFINPKLLAEPNLEKAIACIWKHFYCVFINGHVYMLDADNMTRDTAGNKCYEGYFLENIPAMNVVLPTRDTLYFANGKYLCKFNTDIEGHQAYYDDGTYDASLHLVFGDRIVGCMWESKLDDDNYPQYFKNLSKKGVVITVLAQDESSADVYISKNGGDYIHTEKMTNMGTDGISIDVYPLKKVKKYKRLKFRIENDEPEPFGLIKIVKTWTLGNYAK